MKKLIQATIVTFCFLLATAGFAHAQDEGGRGAAMGVGAETMVLPFGAGVGGVGEFVYDAGQFHIDGLLGFADIENGDTIIAIGGRFYYVLHSGSSADFSVGGGLAILNVNPDMGDSTTDFLLNGGAKIRVFVGNNVALHSTLGLSVFLSDAGEDIFGLGGRLLGNVGLTYFFR